MVAERNLEDISRAVPIAAQDAQHRRTPQDARRLGDLGLHREDLVALTVGMPPLIRHLVDRPMRPEMTPALCQDPLPPACPRLGPPPTKPTHPRQQGENLKPTQIRHSLRNIPAVFNNIDHVLSGTFCTPITRSPSGELIACRARGLTQGHRERKVQLLDQ